MNSIAEGVYTPTKRGYAGRQRARWVLASANDRVLYLKRTDAKKALERPAELQLEPQ